MPGTLQGAYDVSVSDAHDAPAAAETPEATIDLATIETELADVERALERLGDGTYWTCEVTGAEIPDEHLAAHPVSRRAPDATQ
jgi:RNA polymerase-binding transcription factor DksA